MKILLPTSITLDQSALGAEAGDELVSYDTTTPTYWWHGATLMTSSKTPPPTFSR